MYKFKRTLPSTGEGISRTTIDPNKTVSTKDQFELTYLRWRYFMRAENPPTDLIKKYEKAAYKVAKESFNKNYDSMKNSGLEIEDACNIALVHLVSYLGCFSLQYSEHGRSKVEEKKKNEDLSDSEIQRKDLSNLMTFIEQRMKDFVRVFKQKNKNILGEKSVAVLFQLVDKESPCSDQELLRAPKRYGYRKVSASLYKEIKRKLGSYPQVGRFVLGDTVYRYVQTTNNPVWISDSENSDDILSFNPQNYTQPQDLEESLNRYRIEKLLDRYHNSDEKNKVRMLKKAISFLKKKGMMTELRSAKRMLKKLQNGG
jgi:hypothetical protein